MDYFTVTFTGVAARKNAPLPIHGVAPRMPPDEASIALSERHDMPRDSVRYRSQRLAPVMQAFETQVTRRFRSNDMIVRLGSYIQPLIVVASSL